MIPESIFPDPELLEGAVAVLRRIESMSDDATGVLRFPGGSILLESGRVCWAVASTMEQRLTDLLRHQRSPPLDRRFLEEVLASCQRDSRPLGEALLASGEISESGLRTALFRQSVEAIAHIARTRGVGAEFVPHQGSAYDARFLFCTAEIFAALGARRDRALAAAARRQLETLVSSETTALAFARDPGSATQPVMAIVHGQACHVDELREACVWTAGLFDVVELVEPRAFLATGTWGGGVSRRERTVACSAVVWRSLGLYFTALCTTSAAAAVLTGRIATRGRDEARGLSNLRGST